MKNDLEKKIIINKLNFKKFYLIWISTYKQKKKQNKINNNKNVTNEKNLKGCKKIQISYFTSTFIPSKM